MNVTDTFVRYLMNKQNKISDSVVQKAKECRFDYMSVVTAGAGRSYSHWEKLLKNIPEGKSALYGCDMKTDSKTAALINGFNAHCLELDDGQRFAMIHLGAAIISAVDAVSCEYDICPEYYYKGIIMGYEAACRMAIAMQPSHKNRGYHTAGTCGTIGAAMGTAFALHFDEKQLKRVLTLAAASSAGMLEIQEQASELKPYNLGRAAMDGLAAALMGFTDFNVPDDMLGGERGFFHIFSDSYDAGRLTSDADYFEIERIYVKPYVSCRHSHSAVEAAIKLHESVSVNDIDHVEIKTYKFGVKGHDHNEINGTASAKLSTPYAVAASLIYGKADLSVFEPLDENILKLASKVLVKEDETLTKESKQKRAAIVTVFLSDGSKKECRVDYAKGEPENPMSVSDLINKASGLIGEKETQKLYEQIFS